MLETPLQQNCSDGELVLKTLEDKKYFTYIVDRYSDKLLRYIRRITNINEQDREDLLQNVFIKIYLNLNDFDESLSFNAWVYRITHNEVVDFSRQQKRKLKQGYRDTDDDFFLIEKDPFGILEEVYRAEDAHVMREVFQVITEKHREILYLRFIEQYSYKDISDILKKTESNVTSLIHRARNEFKKTYNNYHEKFK